MKSALTTTLASFGLLLFASFAYPAKGGDDATMAAPPADLASKTCTYKDVGSQGCDVKIKIEKGDDNTYCATMTVDCPGGIPAGDPEESCTFEEVCDLTAAMPLEGTCDGQNFKATPGFGNWDAVWKDCSALKVSA